MYSIMTIKLLGYMIGNINGYNIFILNTDVVIILDVRAITIKIKNIKEKNTTYKFDKHF